MTSGPDAARPHGDTGVMALPLDRPRVAVLAGTLVVLAALTLARLGGGDAVVPLEARGYTMGTTYGVLVDAEGSEDEVAQLGRVVQSHLDEVDRLLSTWDSASELSRFNRFRALEPFPVHPVFIETLAVALRVGAASGGAFDVTVGPLVDAWGFGPNEMPDAGPAVETVEALRTRIGFRGVLLDRAAGTVAKGHPDVALDLSGVAKGYAVDRVAETLRSLGHERFLVEVGGELRVGATRRDGMPWRVGIERPEEDGRGLVAVVEVVDQAVATSGDYRQVRGIGPDLRTHLIDPATGRPVPVRGASVTVLHDRAAVADAWATALAVLDPDAAYRLAVEQDLAAFFVTRSDDGFETRATPAFAKRARSIREVVSP